MRYTILKHDWINNAMRHAARACGGAALMAFASLALAGEEPANASTPASPSTSAAATEAKPANVSPVPAKPAATPIAQAQDAPARSSVDFGAPADLGKLEQSRGGTDVHNDMKLDGVVAGNSATNVITGANTIDTGAFANMSGIPVVIQNSGANVLIQNATIVNLQFK